MLEEKHPEEEKIETIEVEVQTDQILEELVTEPLQESVELEPSLKSERVPTQMSERGKPESVGVPASSVKMTKSISHRSIASKAAIILKETGVQTENVQLLPQDVTLEEVLEFKEMKANGPPRISPISLK